jgi:hypothetical protein
MTDDYRHAIDDRVVLANGDENFEAGIVLTPEQARCLGSGQFGTVVEPNAEEIAWADDHICGGYESGGMVLVVWDDRPDRDWMPGDEVVKFRVAEEGAALAQP